MRWWSNGYDSSLPRAKIPGGIRWVFAAQRQLAIRVQIPADAFNLIYFLNTIFSML